LKAVRVFVGITGASGAPYAKRLIQALAAQGCEVGLCVSSAGAEVLAAELYGDAPLSSDEVVARLVEDAPGSVRLYDTGDWHAPYASGSAQVDAYVVCPCSAGTLGALAAGVSQNLIHRAAAVALKEGRKLILCTRETPLSTIQLENMLTLKRAGATILPLEPGFYHGSSSVEVLVDFVVARILDQIGLANELSARWGA
jgi:4-hydroxy-3-polyprenylbenzoate decarboxylase